MVTDLPQQKVITAKQEHKNMFYPRKTLTASYEMK